MACLHVHSILFLFFKVLSHI